MNQIKRLRQTDLKLIDEIEKLEPPIKDKLLFLANAIRRDGKTGKAYAE